MSQYINEVILSDYGTMSIRVSKSHKIMCIKEVSDRALLYILCNVCDDFVFINLDICDSSGFDINYEQYIGSFKVSGKDEVRHVFIDRISDV